jgi:hypothetical protein
VAMTSRQEERHAEIKRRYGRKWGAALKCERIKSVRRVQVLRVLCDRHGKTLPDDVHGRVALQILFELGLDAVAAQKLAPWIDHQQLNRLIDAADGNWRDWSKRRDRETRQSTRS